MPCRNHPQMDQGLDHCHRCGYLFCEECRVEFQRHPHCAACKAEAVGMLEAGLGGSDGGAELPPWERRQELGTMTAFIDTLKAVISNPTGFFRNYDATATSWDCLAVPCVLTTISTATIMAVYVLFYGTVMSALSAQLGPEFDGGALTIAMLLMGSCMYVVLAPVFAIITTFVMSGLMHAFVMMTGKVTRPKLTRSP